MKLLVIIASLFLLTACLSEQPVEKAIIGTWVQDVPVSMSDEGLQTTTSETQIKFEKDGDIKLNLVMGLQGRNIPDTGIFLDVDLKGTWQIQNGQLIQTPVSASVTPRSQSETALSWAETWQEQANTQSPTTKSIIKADRKQLILQDIRTGATDVYRRK